ncbi:MAG: glycosyltransferase, partial [Terriglobales bacterium]
CIDHAKGDAVITLDADLQDPPEVFPEMVQRWKEGNDVVLAQRRARAGETKLRRWIALKFYEFLQKHSDVELAVEVGDFRLLSRKAIDRLDMFREKRRYVRGLVSWIGLKQTLLPYDRDKRFAGVSKYGFYKLVRLAIDGVSSFTLLPLRFTHMIGIIVCFLAVVMGIYFTFRHFQFQTAVEGWQIATIILSFLAGMQFVCIGLLSEYVAVIHEETKDRPLYLVGEIF